MQGAHSLMAVLFSRSERNFEGGFLDRSNLRRQFSAHSVALLGRGSLARRFNWLSPRAGLRLASSLRIGRTRTIAQFGGQIGERQFLGNSFGGNTRGL